MLPVCPGQQLHAAEGLRGRLPPYHMQRKREVAVATCLPLPCNAPAPAMLYAVAWRHCTSVLAAAQPRHLRAVGRAHGWAGGGALGSGSGPLSRGRAACATAIGEPAQPGWRAEPLSALGLCPRPCSLVVHGCLQPRCASPGLLIREEVGVAAVAGQEGVHDGARGIGVGKVQAGKVHHGRGPPARAAEGWQQVECGMAGWRKVNG